jgi:hypothetical protein
MIGGQPDVIIPRIYLIIGCLIVEFASVDQKLEMCDGQWKLLNCQEKTRKLYFPSGFAAQSKKKVKRLKQTYKCYLALQTHRHNPPHHLPRISRTLLAVSEALPFQRSRSQMSQT